MRYLHLVFIIFYCYTSSAQVGIGTIDPHPSSQLEMDSDTKGLLAPRMTTAEKLAIDNPANGLLVFDETTQLFYFYDSEGEEWKSLNSSSETRDNYKLVKSVSDLAPELAAGGGSKYLLTTNALYEINGLIELEAPIDLNNAYLIGLDANEDILSRSGNSIFTGNTGGTIKNLSLTAPSGGTVFNLSGSAGQTLVVRNAVIIASGSVGNISGYGLVFSNVINYVGNAQGITYNNINQLLLANQAWSGNNAGTYETFTGTFGLIQKQGGFSQINGSNVGINSTGVTDINGAAVIENTVFYGSSNTYVVGISPYNNFNFTNDWFVECPGIPVEKDGTASGSYYMSNNPTATTINTANVPVKIQGVTIAANNLFRTSTEALSNNLKYTGSKSRNFEVTVTGTVTPNTNNPIHIYHIYKNGSPVPSITAERRYYSNDVGNFALTGIVSLSSGDYIEVFMESNTTSSPIVNRMNVILK